MDAKRIKSEGDKNMKKLICFIIILCLIPVPVSGMTWAEFAKTAKKVDAYLHTEDGKKLVLVGILAAGWVWARFIKGPAKYIYKNGKFRPYNPKKHLFLILPENT
jgi:hypothetical protein